MWTSECARAREGARLAAALLQLRLHHLLALAGEDEEDLLRTGMVVPQVALSRVQPHQANGHGLRRRRAPARS